MRAMKDINKIIGAMTQSECLKCIKLTQMWAELAEIADKPYTSRTESEKLYREMKAISEERNHLIRLAESRILQPQKIS